jgi:hypothetical protein
VRDAVDEVIRGNGLALRTKTTPEMRLRYARDLAAGLREHLSTSSLADVRNPHERPTPWILELLDLRGVSERLIVEELSKYAESRTHTHNVCTELLALLIERGDPIPQGLRSFAAKVLRGQCPKPLNSGRPRQNSLRDGLIRAAVRRAREVDPKVTYANIFSVVAERLSEAGQTMGKDTDGADSIAKIWARRKRRA